MKRLPSARDLAKRSAQHHGVTLVELVSALVILAIVIGLALPRYLGAGKHSYLAEADHILQEVKGLEWAYYQQSGQFDITGSSLGLVLPGGMHWGAPMFSGNAAQSVSIKMTGSVAPLKSSDSVCLTPYTDGSAVGSLTCASSTGSSSTGSSTTGGSSTVAARRAGAQLVAARQVAGRAAGTATAMGTGTATGMGTATASNEVRIVGLRCRAADGNGARPSVVITVVGQVTPLAGVDRVSVVLNGDGSASAGATF